MCLQHATKREEQQVQVDQRRSTREGKQAPDRREEDRHDEDRHDEDRHEEDRHDEDRHEKDRHEEDRHEKDRHGKELASSSWSPARMSPQRSADIPAIIAPTFSTRVLAPFSSVAYVSSTAMPMPTGLGRLL